jgi:hypothetical protein
VWDYGGEPTPDHVSGARRLQTFRTHHVVLRRKCDLEGDSGLSLAKKQVISIRFELNLQVQDQIDANSHGPASFDFQLHTPWEIQSSLSIDTDVAAKIARLSKADLD